MMKMHSKLILVLLFLASPVTAQSQDDPTWIESTPSAALQPTDEVTPVEDVVGSESAGPALTTQPAESPASDTPTLRQETPYQQTATMQPDAEDDNVRFQKASSAIQQQLRDAVAEYNRLVSRIGEEKLPLNKKLRSLEDELIQVRNEYQSASRKLDTQTFELSKLGSEIKALEEQASYLSNLIGEYIRNFESRVHIAEKQRYERVLEDALNAPGNGNLSEHEVFNEQLDLVSASLNRLEGALGGDRFEGAAVAEAAGNKVKKGQFVIIGPAAYFKSDDGQTVGTAEERLGSLQPNVIAFRKSEAGEAVAEVIEKGDGRLPVDPTLGNAHVVEATEENIIEHASKGGPVMYPIVILAGAAFLVALVKFVGMIFLRKPRPRNISELLAKVAGNDTEGAREQAAQIRGPAGEMLRIGADHLGEPPELIEEVMYEKVLSTRLRVQRMLPFIAISAAAAPLLGLLGTVTGIINTFKLITVFGTGDVKTLSGGISEALITTEFGLIVAIPSLLLHAFLSRRARSIVDQMEKSAVAFMNEVSRARYRRGEWETGEGAELEDVEPRGESGDMPRTQENPEEGSNGDGRPREGAYETEATT